MTRGKSGVASMACAAAHRSRENQALLIYAASGNIALRLKSDTVFCAL